MVIKLSNGDRLTAGCARRVWRPRDPGRWAARGARRVRGERGRRRVVAGGRAPDANQGDKLARPPATTRRRPLFPRTGRAPCAQDLEDAADSPSPLLNFITIILMSKGNHYHHFASLQIFLNYVRDKQWSRHSCTSAQTGLAGRLGSTRSAPGALAAGEEPDSQSKSVPIVLPSLRIRKCP